MLAPGFRALDERERKILQLRFFDGLTQSQIAQQVGISQMHVSRLIRRSLEKIREEIASDEEPRARAPAAARHSSARCDDGAWHRRPGTTCMRAGSARNGHAGWHHVSLHHAAPRERGEAEVEQPRRVGVHVRRVQDDRDERDAAARGRRDEARPDLCV